MRPSVFSRLAGHARPYASDYAAGFVLLLATNALALGIPWLLRGAIHEMERGTSGRVLLAHASGMVALALAQAGARTWSRLRILGASRRVAYDLRNAYFSRLEQLDAAYYDRNRTGDVMSRGVNDVQLLQAMYGPGAMNLLNTAIVYVAVTAIMFRLDVPLTLLSIALLPFLYLAVNRVSRGVYARSLAVQEQLARISDRTQENLSGIRQVKIYAQEEAEIGRFRALCEDYRDRNLALARLRGTMLSFIGVYAGIGTLAVLFAGGLRVIGGAMTFGDFVAYNAYLAQLAWPTVALGWIVNVFQRGAGALARLEEVLSAIPRIPPPAEDGETAEVDGDIEIRGLTFAYEGASRPALSDVTLKIPRGERVAIVGPVGSGKSTLVNLLARVYAAPPGTIRVDGRDVSAIPVGAVRRSTGLVPQEAFLFSRTLRDNVRLGRPEASEHEIGRAIAVAGLDGEIASLPRGLDTVVGERGYTLSGGQRQRATIARAILTDPRRLLLDDALSSVDADTERRVLRGLGEGAPGRTTVLVTHRLSTLAGVPRIVVLEAGRVVEDGSHAELLERGGTYARLFRRQELEARLGDA